MKTRMTGRVLVLLLATAAAGAAQADSGAEDPRLAQSRALVGEFAAELQGALKSALQSGGPTEAVYVCRDLAPQIASRLSRQSGAAVGRVSSRYRNPLNAPDDRQMAVLEQFSAAMADADDTTAPPEQFSVDSEGRAHYMKAIPAAPLCLVCHGETLAAPVAEQLAADYPHDLATGYRAGELRGAFSIVWPAP